MQPSQPIEAHDILTIDTQNKLLLLSEKDNVFVALVPISTGPTQTSDNRLLVVGEAVTLGQKVARVNIADGEKIIKYGVSIGLATKNIKSGQHVHVHNMKSDYTSTHHLKETAQGGVVDA